MHKTKVDSVQQKLRDEKIKKARAEAEWLCDLCLELEGQARAILKELQSPDFQYPLYGEQLCEHIITDYFTLTSLIKNTQQALERYEIRTLLSPQLLEVSND